MRKWNRGTRTVEDILTDDGNDAALVASPVEGDDVVLVALPRRIERVDTLSGKSEPVADLPEIPLSLAASRDATLAVVGCEHRTAVVVDLPASHIRHRLETSALDVHCIAICPHNRYVATGGIGSEIELWNAQTGLRQRTMPGHANRTTCLVFSPDGQRLISGGFDDRICIWNVANGRLVVSLPGRASPVEALAISPDGKTLASGTRLPAHVDLWDLSTFSKLTSLETSLNLITALRFTPDGRGLLVGNAGGSLVEWSLDQQPEFPNRNAAAPISVLDRIPISERPNHDVASGARPNSVASSCCSRRTNTRSDKDSQAAIRRIAP